jgi:hypothetical protein
MSADPLTQTIYNLQMLNRYTYVKNGPLGATDPTGEIIQAENEGDQAQLAAAINEIAAGNYGFDKDGRLVNLSSESPSGHSSYYASRLDYAIKSLDTVYVNISPVYHTAEGIAVRVDDCCDGGVTYRDADGDLHITVTEDDPVPLLDLKGMPIAAGIGWTLAHEIVAHAVPAMGLTDTGDGVKDENKVRKEVPGAGERAPDRKPHVEGLPPPDQGLKPSSSPGQTMQAPSPAQCARGGVSCGSGVQVWN